MEESDFYQLRDPLPADPFLPAAAGLPLWIWILIAVAAISLPTLLFVRIRRRKPSPAIDLPAARRKAIAALNAINPATGATAVATSVSLLLRRFLADTLADPALFETHEELLARDAALAGLPDKQLAPTRDHFATLARLKYGPDTEADTQALLTDARSLLTQLQPTITPPPPPLPNLPTPTLTPDS